MTKQNGTALYSLGMEELAMGLGLINRADLGRELLASLYGELNEEQVDARLGSASHSLLARGLVAISDKGSPVLEAGLEKALFPLARFDFLVQLSIVKGGSQSGATIHIQKQGTYSSHSIHAGVVHVLETGPRTQLGTYIQDTFEGFGGRVKARGSELAVTSGTLGKASKMIGDQKAITSLLLDAGVPETDSKPLAEDLANQVMRGTILRIQADQTSTPEAVRDAPRQMLLLLQGESRSWLFHFESTDDRAVGRGGSVGPAAFREAIVELVG